MNKIWILMLVFIVCSCDGTNTTRKYEMELADKQAKIDSLIKVSQEYKAGRDLSFDGTNTTRKYEMELADKQAKIDSLIKVSQKYKAGRDLAMLIQLNQQNEIEILKKKIN